MDTETLLAAILHMPPFLKWAYGMLLLALFAIMGFLLLRERRHFGQQNKAGSWLTLRLCALPILALVAAVVLLPARMIGGPEALAYFYIALFTLGPLTWFGGHLLCGRLTRPSFTRSESLYLGGSGLIVLITPFIVLSIAQGPIFLLSRHFEETTMREAEVRPLAYTAETMQTFALDGVGTVFTQTLRAPPGIRLERIDLKTGDAWYNSKGSMHPVFCRNDDDIHLMWSAREPAPALRLYWRTGEGALQQAAFATNPAAGNLAPERNFSIHFRPDGIDPPVPIPRNRVSIGHFVGGGNKLYFDSPGSIQPGESFENDCTMPGYKRVNHQKEGPPQAVALFFQPPGNQPPLRAEIIRP